jgi:hypothetical protein
MVDRRVACGVLAGTPESKGPRGTQRPILEGNIKVDLQDVRWGGIEWFDLAQDRDRWMALVNAVMNLRVQ